MRNQKGQGVSINTLIIIALAVFAVFIVINFVSGGVGQFSALLGGATGTSEYQAAKARCGTYCTNWVNEGCPTTGYTYQQVTTTRTADLDGDPNTPVESYSCRGDVNPIMSASECGCGLFGGGAADTSDGGTEGGL